MSSLRLEEDGNFRKTDREDERLKFVGAGPKVSFPSPSQPILTAETHPLPD